MNPTSTTATEVLQPKIKIRDLDFFYDRFQALHHINLDIPARQVTAFIGPSGCGKTTLIRCLNRIYTLHPGHRAVGRIELDGEDILSNSYDLMALRAKVGMVFQRPTPFPMSIRDNIAFGIKLYERLKRAELDERVTWALQKVALWDEVRDKLYESALRLSGGQQQRLCIARAIAVRPEILLLDEPTTALDPYSTLRIEELISEFRGEYTVILVTHDMQQAARVSDYTAFLDRGELVEFSDTDTLFTNPRKRRTDDYITGRYG